MKAIFRVLMLFVGLFTVVGCDNSPMQSVGPVSNAPVEIEGHKMLFPTIELGSSFSILHGGGVNGFSASNLGETVKVEFTFTFAPPAELVMFFQDKDNNNLILKAESIEENKAIFSFAWEATPVQTELLGLGVESRHYGFLSFYGQRSGKLAKPAMNGSFVLSVRVVE